MDAEPPRIFLSVPEAGKIFRSEYTLKEAFAQGLPYIRMGKRTYVDRRDIEQFLLSRKEAAPACPGNVPD